MEYESDGTPRDLWDNSPAWNAKPQPKFEPLTIESLKKAQAEKEVKTLTSMAERYKKAWNTVYSRLPEWRRKEVDEAMKSGKLPDKGWADDFSRQVAALAEKQ